MQNMHMAKYWWLGRGGLNMSPYIGVMLGP